MGGAERALRFAAEAMTVKRVVVTATMASVCGTQRDASPEHLWSEADKNDAPGSAYSKSKTAAEAKVWELAEQHKDKYAVCTVHPAVVLGNLLEGQAVTSTMGILQGLAKGKVSEAEPFLDDVIVHREVVVDATTWRHSTAWSWPGSRFS